MATTLSASASRTRSIAYVALSIALMAVGAWVTVPLGPVPFTLQIFVFTFALVMLEPKLAMAAVVGYIVLGAIGVPVFSSMRGGIGVLAGPTGGFLWGYIVGFALAIAVGSLLKVKEAPAGKRFDTTEVVRAFVMSFVYLACAYVCGWFQLMLVMGIGPEAAFASAVAPFILVDIVKIIVAVFVALAVKHALGAVR
ncbi:MAG: biotin transporter BioY [Coriobacteriaceae bacterium]|nr:biotin transporter BioY [Coriobacteriaceae bacterium]